jgi:hypothetical protein
MPEDVADDHDLIVRIDERVKQAVAQGEQRDIYHRQDTDRMIKLFQETITAFTSTITSMSTNYVTRAEWASARNDITRLERIIYGAVGIVLVAFIGALVTLVWKGNGGS